MNLQWFVLQVPTQFEARVKKLLEERIMNAQLEASFGEILIPSEEVEEMREGKKRRSERKFFPGYLLIHMEMTDDTWHLVRNTPRVLGFVGGTSDKPMPISDSEIDAIFNRMEEGSENPRPKTLFNVGEEVRVVDGPFTEFMGTVEAVNYEKNRISVSLEIFGRRTPVELEFHQVEKRI